MGILWNSRTRGPGFPFDESVSELGTHLMLPPWLEKHRGEIESALAPVKVPEWKLQGV